MTYKEDQNFSGLLNLIKHFNIQINRNYLNRLYENLKMYVDVNSDGTIDLTIPNFYPETYFVNLAIRELGGRTNSFFDKVDEPLSNDISTIHFSDYFAESTENTLSRILSEIKRITKKNFDYQLINETKYDESKEETAITIEYIINEKKYKMTHDNNLRRGTLLAGFITDELLPTIRNSISKGHLLYFSESSIQFIYFQLENDYRNFIKSIDYYSEI